MNYGIPKKRRRQCETCINCRSSRKQCDKGNPCRNCDENNRKCLYAKEFPYSELSQEEQATVLERLLYDARGKFELLKKCLEQNAVNKFDSQAVITTAANRHLTRNIRLEADMYNDMRHNTASRLITVSMPGQPEWCVQDQVYKVAFDRNTRIILLMDEIHKETVPPQPRLLEFSDFSIDLARAMVSVEEVEMLIALYNDCYSFSSLPDFISPHFDENGEYDLLLSSVITLMLSHTVNLHQAKLDNHEHLSHAFYYHTKELRDERVVAGIDIMSLHATYNLMLYEAENGYLDEAALSRRYMTVMIEALHADYPTMSVWQQSLLRHLFWAIFTADASRHNMQIQQHVICSHYMSVDKQRPSDHCMQLVDKLKEEYIYYRCRLADVVRHIWAVCYGVNVPSVHGSQIKELENELWALYNELPAWITSEDALGNIVLETHKGYECYCGDPNMHSRTHPICKRSLVEVWMRRLRYHFLVEWHGTWLYLYQVFLPQPGEIIQLPFIRCLEHGKLMVDVLARWADDPDFFDCYCYPSLRSLMVASHIHRYLLQSQFKEIRDKGYELLLELFTIIRRSNIYHLYKDTTFITSIKAAFDSVRCNYLPSIPDANIHELPLAADELDLYMFSAAAS
ncbi:hypothetical protein DFQ28_007399 [Apophysomyces sp. BC1034]|nr:hypothetical protein DFQ30_007084 [Apophysomyces sp. BC1015]KAG0181071.1 hypothetical protein DFQ29_009386 [Apophysomyces sp. BC1021]KAG0186722.1 hypothetical protein DFQ28_007399 [Apophysomyces sp. BC1034]